MSITPEIIADLVEKLGKKHIMLSYNWGVQDLVRTSYEYLESRGIPVWMDIKGGMSGNINASMAKAVENAMVICPFMTEAYESSESCELELNYAKDSQVQIVPCMVQNLDKDGGRYRATGWLGVITAGKLWTDFRYVEDDGAKIAQQCDVLLLEIANKLNVDTSGGFKPVKPPPKAAAPKAAPQKAAPSPKKAAPAPSSQGRESWSQYLCTFQENGGIWTIGDKRVQCGMRGDIPIPADYFNEKEKQIAVWRPSNGNWYIKGSGYSDWSESSNTVIQCGKKGDIPVAGDYLGDGEITVAVWGPSNGNWYLKGKPMTSNWGSSSVNLVIQCGCAGDVPVPQDYFNEGKLRIAVWRPSNGNWYIKGVGMASWGQSGGNLAVQCGMAGDIPVPGDYYGDGIVRIAVWRPSNGVWYIKGTGTADWAHTNGNVAIQCGCKGDIPVPYDFFNEGKVRIAVFRPTAGKFYIKGDGMHDWGSSSGNIVFPGGDLLVHQIPVNFYS